MPPHKESTQTKTFQQLIEDVGTYPAEAYQFVQEGLSYTVQKLHGVTTAAAPAKGPATSGTPAGPAPAPQAGASTGEAKLVSRHISGQQLCEGLREFALAQWGMLARTVLMRWNITGTIDFGRIVFALVEIGQMQKTDDDSIEDFRNVYDFRSALETRYQIPGNP